MNGDQSCWWVRPALYIIANEDRGAERPPEFEIMETLDYYIANMVVVYCNFLLVVSGWVHPRFFVGFKVDFALI